MALEDDALRLAELDRRVIRDFIENNTEEFGHAVSEYLTLRAEVKKRLIDEPSCTVENADAADVLRKILGGGGLPSDPLIEAVIRRSHVEYNIDEIDEGDIEKIGSDIFYSWFSHYEYVRGLAELRPLILHVPVPDFVSRLVRQIRDCYAFQQYDAAYGLSRTLIEACVRDICVRRKLFPDVADNVIMFEMYQWTKLRDKVAWGPAWERLKNLYSDLSTLLHGRKTVTQDEALKAFKATVEMVEELYALHGFAA